MSVLFPPSGSAPPAGVILLIFLIVRQNFSILGAVILIYMMVYMKVSQRLPRRLKDTVEQKPVGCAMFLIV